MIRILYVDDEPDMLVIGKLYLEESGDFSVSTIDSAAAALSLLKKERFDAVVADYEMPVMDGISLLQHVRREIGKIPFILFTGRGREEVVILALNNGADFYLQKGGDPASQFAELRHKLLSAIGRYSAEKKTREKTEELEALNEKLTAADEELRHTMDALAENENLYRTLFHEMLNGFAVHEIICDENGTPRDYRFLEVNAAFERMTGLSRDDLIGRTVLDVMPDTEPVWIGRYGQVALTGSPDHFENYSRDLDKFFEVTVYQNVRAQFTTIISDVTERKRAEERNQWLASFPELNPNPIIEMDAEGTITFANTATIRALRDLGLPEDPAVFVPKEKDEILHLLKHGTETQIYREITLNNETFAENISLNRQLHVMRIYARNITERKRAEEALRESEEKFRQLFTHMPSAVAIYDAVDDGEDFIIKDFNTAAEKIERIKKDDLIGKRVTQVFPGVKDFGVFAVFQRVWRTGQPEFFPSAIYRDERDPGTWREIWVYKLASGEIIAIYHDITERKRTEEALRESEEKYRLAMDATSDGLWDWDVRTNRVYYSPAWLRILGEDSIPPVYGSWEKRIHPDDRVRVISSLREQLEGKTGSWQCEHRLSMNPGGWKWVLGRGHVVTRNPEGSPLRVVGTMQDIAMRKRAEEALVESEERFRTIIHSIQFGIVIIDAQSHTILEANQKALDMIGGTSDIVSGSVCHRFICPAESGRCPVTDLKQTVDSSERVLLTRQGAKMPILKSVIRSMLGGKDVLIESFIDITDQKRAEETLLATEKRYHNVVEDQTEFICRFLPDGTHIFVNDAYCRYFDRKREDLIGHRFRPVLHPEDREMVAQRIASITPQHPVINIDQRIIMPYGSTRWQRWSDRAIFDPDGRVVEYQSVGRDITKQKELEKEMEYNSQELRKFSTSLAAANRKLNLLSSITRHDITNELTVLQGYLTILERKQPDTTTSGYFQKVITAAQHISTMIQFTREYEAIGVMAPVWQDCRKLVDTAAKEAPLRKVIVKNDLPDGAEVLADPLIVKVFYNLMDNAARYGGKCTTIRFSVEERDGDHLIVCEDDGDGVVAEDKERIFEQGFGNNTGLGLFLSREILSITGITIKETGEPGKGARFEMVVPKGTWRMAGTGA